jgi:hypothetical protein
MDRKAACLAQASACREKAEADPANSDYWIDESIKWLERAVTPTDRVAISFEVGDGQVLPKVRTDRADEG